MWLVITLSWKSAGEGGNVQRWREREELHPALRETPLHLPPPHCCRAGKPAAAAALSMVLNYSGRLKTAVRGADMLRPLRERCPRLHLALYTVLKYKPQSLLTGYFRICSSPSFIRCFLLGQATLKGDTFPQYLDQLYGFDSAPNLITDLLLSVHLWQGISHGSNLRICILLSCTMHQNLLGLNLQPIG